MTLSDKFRQLSSLCLEIADDMDKKDAEMKEYWAVTEANRGVLKQIGELINNNL